MVKADFYQDDFEKEGRSRRGGRRGRGRKKWTFLLLFVGAIALVICAAPTVLCQTSIMRNLLASTMSDYGFDGRVESIQIGWFAPLRLEGFEARGQAAGSLVKVDQVETELSLFRLLGGLDSFGEVAIRGVVADLSVTDGTSSLEQDLAAMLTNSAEGSTVPETSNEPTTLPAGQVTVQNLAIRISDQAGTRAWIADQSKLDLKLDPSAATVAFSTVLSEPSGGSGELEAQAEFPTDATKPYQMQLGMQRVPLSIALLVKRWLGDAGQSIPGMIGGDSTGTLTVSGDQNATYVISVPTLEIRNLVASDPALGERVWRNGLTAVRGVATLQGDRILGQDVQVKTDFAELFFNGAFNTSISLGGDTTPTTWLEALDGSAGVNVDLVAFEQALPGLIPLRDQTRITSGKISAEVTSQIDSNAIRRSHWNLSSEPIRAVAGTRNLTIEPATLIASLRVNEGRLAAETVRLESAFANITGEGELANGRLKGDIQFSRLAGMIQPLLDMPQLSLAGQANGEMSWSAEAKQLWRLSGNGRATDLMIAIPGSVSIQQSELLADIKAEGVLASATLEELRVLSAKLESTGVEATVDLTSPVKQPLSHPLPLRITSRGRLEALAALLDPWLPEDLHTLQGGYTASAVASVAADQGEVTVAKVQLEGPRAGYGTQWFAQPQLLVDFDGRYAWPTNTLEARKLTILGEALSAAAQGTFDASGVNAEVAWRAKVERLMSAIAPQVASSANLSAQPVAFRDSPTPAAAPGYTYSGDCEGRILVKQLQDSELMAIESHTTANQFKIHRAGAPQSEPVWQERLVQLDTQFNYATADGKVDAQKLQLATDWFATTLAGQALWSEAVGDVALRGNARVKMPDVAANLSKMLGLTVQLEGVHDTPVEILAARKGDGPVALNVKANVGWESGSVAGIQFGSTAIPVEMNETTVSVKPAAIPVIQGRLQVAGDLQYSPGPMYLTVRPGVIAEDLTLTQELTSQWMQYLAPVVANATRVEGRFGVELAEAVVNIDDPNASKIRGNLRITGVNLDSGPVANQIIGSVRQIQQLVRGGTVDNSPTKDKRLATFPTQSVDFEFANGVVSHQRLTMEIDRAKIITSGQVHVDGRLKMVAQVPLDSSWLGSDLKGLAGQTVSLPIDGTLSRPSLDSNGIRNLVGEMGAKALQTTAESYLEKQLGRGLDKLFGK